MDDNSVMTFGVHKGKKLANVPANYLLWLNDQSWCKPEMKKYITENLDVLNKEQSARR